jgi:hypothetical protein
MIKPWIFEFFAAPRELVDRFDPQASQRYFDAYLESITSAQPTRRRRTFSSPTSP